MAKKKVNIFIDEELWAEFKRLAFQKHENFHGALSYEVEQAFQAWLAHHTQKHTKPLIPNSINPQPRVARIFSQVRDYLKQQYGYVSLIPGQQVPKPHLRDAIMAVRGTDYRTVNKWMGLFTKFKLIKWVAGQLYEIV